MKIGSLPSLPAVNVHEQPLAFIRQDDVARLARLALADGDHAGIGVEIGSVHRGQFGIAAAGQQRAADKIAEMPARKH